MSLRINHNLAALNAHRNLVNTTNELSSSMQKLSSGFRINQGSDNPAGLVISEQFRAQIAGLNRAIENSEGSISMIQTAEGALTEINSLLISMRELAIHAANEGFNDADQLAADQAEIANAVATIDRIAANTQFGTKKLIDGSKDNTATITSANNAGVTIKTSGLTSGSHSISATKTADAGATLNTTSLGLTLNNVDGDPYNLSEAVHTVDVIQGSDVAAKTTGSVTMTDAFGNGLEIAAAGSKAVIDTASGTVNVNAAAANLGTYTMVVNYQEKGQSPTGDQTISVAVGLGDTKANLLTNLQAQINLNSQLAGKVVVQASAATAGAIQIVAASEGAQYSVETKASSDTATTSWFTFGAGSDRGASSGTISMTVNTATNSNVTDAAVVVGAATYTSLSALATAIDTAVDTAFGKVAGATGTSDLDVAVFDTNKLQFHTNDEGSDYSVKVNSGVAGTQNILNALNTTSDTIATSGIDSLVSFDNYTNTITTVKYGSTSDITLKNAADGDSTQGTMAMTVNTALNGLNLGNLLVDVTASKFDVRLDGGPANAVTAGVDSTVFNADRTESMELNLSLTSAGGSETISNVDRSLVFQIGANVGQTANIGLRGMSSSQLGQGNAGNLYSSLAGIDVTSVQGAQDSQAIIDAAINEVSTTRGTLGSFQKNTLESNLRNLRVAAQNLTASESMIRDTDMAKEMSVFTKNQILVQAGVSMLAQANQTPQVVLSLFG